MSAKHSKNTKRDREMIDEEMKRLLLLFFFSFCTTAIAAELFYLQDSPTPTPYNYVNASKQIFNSTRKIHSSFPTLHVIHKFNDNSPKWQTKDGKRKQDLALNYNDILLYFSCFFFFFFFFSFLNKLLVQSVNKYVFATVLFFYLNLFTLMKLTNLLI